MYVKKCVGRTRTYLRALCREGDTVYLSPDTKTIPEDDPHWSEWIPFEIMIPVSVKARSTRPNLSKLKQAIRSKQL